MELKLKPNFCFLLETVAGVMAYEGIYINLYELERGFLSTGNNMFLKQNLEPVRREVEG